MVVLVLRDVHCVQSSVWFSNYVFLHQHKIQSLKTEEAVGLEAVVLFVW
jgi:hypothetical protein